MARRSLAMLVVAPQGLQLQGLACTVLESEAAVKLLDVAGGGGDCATHRICAAPHHGRVVLHPVSRAAGHAVCQSAGDAAQEYASITMCVRGNVLTAAAARAAPASADAPALPLHPNLPAYF